LLWGFTIMANTVTKPRYRHLLIGGARTADVFAAKRLAEAIERKKRTEAKLAEYGLQTQKPLMSLVK
jgi:hypothetical protein